MSNTMLQLLQACREAYLVRAKLPRKLKKAMKKVDFSGEGHLVHESGQQEFYQIDIVNVNTRYGRKAARMIEKAFHATVANIKSMMQGAPQEQEKGDD
jgi:hypothetical protein